MKYNPHEYQKYTTEFIINNPISAIFLDCGLGKTAITLAALNDLLFDRFEIQRVLIIAPLRVAKFTWTDEIKKWDYLNNINFTLIIGTEKERMEALNKQSNIYIINRENITWLANNSDFNFDMLVIDELSSFKSSRTLRFKALKKVRPKVKRIVGLTGTPAPNGLMDLWAEIGILDMGKRLGKFIGKYREIYFTPDKRNQTIVFSYKLKPGAEKAIYDKISDICVSMKSTSYLDMPECIYNKIFVNLKENETKLYKKLKSDLLLPLEDKEIDAKNSASLANKLLQMANGAVYDEDKNVIEIHNNKLDALEDLIESLNGKSLLIAYWFKHDLDRILKRFKAVKIETSEDITSWNEGKINIGVIHPASCGHGLNLQSGGSTLVWFGLTWSLELYQQTNARLWRQGQKNNVIIHHLVAKNTIDEDVLKALESKEVTQSKLIEAVKVNLKGDY